MSGDYERIREALNFVDPCDRDTWVRMGMGVKDELGDEGLDLWDEWSRAADNYSVSAARAVWKGIQPGGGVTIGSVFHEAKQSGWQPSGGYQAREISPEEKAERERKVKAKRDKDEREAKRASEQFRSLWKRPEATRVRSDHPYMVSRGVEPTDSLREIPAHAIERAIGYAPKHEDTPLKGRVLMVPIKGPSGGILGGELIDECGLKTVLYGTAPKGGYWSPEQLPEGNGEGFRILIAEGMATALSARAATGDPTLAARYCGNVPTVTAMARERWPKARIVVLGERGGGLRFAEQAARESGAELATFDDDANTEHRANGLAAVKDRIDGAQAPPPVPAQGPASANRSGAFLASPRIVLRSGADVEPEAIEWLWLNWLARGKLHILAGPPGTGKTTLAVALASALSTGGRWPDGERAPKLRTLIWSGEDGIEDTLVPRLLAMGADRSMISFIGGVSDEMGIRSFDPSQDVPLLVDALARMDDVGLVIVDPIVSAVASDSNKNAEVRRALQPMVDMANAKGCAVLGISHFSKGTAGRDPVERVTGSIAFGALARVVLAAAKIEDQVNGQTWRLLARAKSNIGPDDGGYKYDLQQIEVPGYSGLIASRVLWGDAVAGSARELLAQAEETESPEDRDERKSAMDFVKSELEGGPRDAGEMIREGERQGFNKRAVQRASARLGVQRMHKKELNGGWTWTLPEGDGDPRRCQGDSPQNLAPCVTFGAVVSSSTEGDISAPLSPSVDNAEVL